MYLPFDVQQRKRQERYGWFLLRKKELQAGTLNFAVVLERQTYSEIPTADLFLEDDVEIDFKIYGTRQLAIQHWDVRPDQVRLDLHRVNGVVSALTATCLSAKHCFVSNCKVVKENTNRGIAAKAKKSLVSWSRSDLDLQPLALGETCVMQEDSMFYNPQFNIKPHFNLAYQFAKIDRLALEAFAQYHIDHTPNDYLELREVEDVTGPAEHNLGTTIKIIVGMSILIAFLVVALLSLQAKSSEPAARRLSSGRRRI